MEKSFATKTIKHHRNILLLMITSPIIVMFSVSVLLYVNSRSGADAQTSYRPPYDPTAIFNTPIPANYPTDSRSSSIIPRWSSVIASSNYSGLFFGISGEVPALNKSNNSHPVYSWSTGNGSGTFRVNTNAVAGSGSDHPTIIINTDTKQELRVWQASINHSNRTIRGTLSGLFYINNDGTIKNPNGSRSVSIPYSGGGAGNGLSYYAGMITRDDWNAGVIRHALRIAYDNCSFNGGTWRIPATKSDQPNGCTSAGSSVGMDMGMILQLNSSVDCNSRTSPTGNANHTKFIRMVCKAMQDYGVMIADGTGASAVFYMEDNLTAKWSEVMSIPSNGHFGSLFRNPSGTNGIPWNQFRVVAKPASYTSWGAGTPASPAPPSPTPPPPAPSPPPPSPSPTTPSPPSSSTQSPYTIEIAIPGQLEAENYDKGGQGVAYNDVESANQGGKYRTDSVDIEDSQSNGYSVGYVKSGEWLEYSTKINESGKYNVTFRVARSSTTAGTWQLKSGSTILGTVTVTDTGGWYAWKDVTVSNVELTSGTKILRLESSGGGVNIDRITFTKQGSPTPPPPPPAPAPTVPSNPRPPISIPGAGTSNPVPIPEELPVESDGTLIADFNGDGLNEVVRDINSDGLIDPETEIIIDGTKNYELTDSSAKPLSAEEYSAIWATELSGGDSSISVKLGSLPEAKIPKIVVYGFAFASGVSFVGLGAYISILKFGFLPAIRQKWGL